MKDFGELGITHEPDAFTGNKIGMPGERMFTYVNPKLIRSANPGYCFKVCGWRICGVTKKRKLIILEKMNNPIKTIM